MITASDRISVQFTVVMGSLDANEITFDCFAMEELFGRSAPGFEPFSAMDGKRSQMKKT
jgi:hypothetical protein